MVTSQFRQLPFQPAFAQKLRQGRKEAIRTAERSDRADSDEALK